MDLLELYNSNKEFKEYVDKFADKKGITPKETLEYSIVAYYAQYLLSK